MRYLSKLRPTVLTALFCIGASLGVIVSPGTAQDPQTGPKRSLLAGDYEKKILANLKADNTVVWQMPIQAIHDAQSLPNGHWLIQTNFRNVVELDAAGKEVWRYDAGKTAEGKQIEIHAFRRLPSD